MAWKPVLKLARATGLALAAGLLVSATPPPAASRPNIVIILMDDMGFSDIGSYGGEIPTPNLDALAANGLRFTQFYNSARCSPSRAALMTGLNPHQAGMGFLDNMVKPESRGTFGRLHRRAVTVAEALRPAGYLTGIAGKWHMGLPNGTTPWNRGFDHSLISSYGEVYYKDQPEPIRRKLWLDGKEISTGDPRLGTDYWYGVDLWTRWGLEFIDKARAQNKPFLFYLPHVAVHFPVMAPPEDIKRFRGEYMRDWLTLRRERYARQTRMGLIGANGGLPAPEDGAYDWDKLSKEERKRFDEMMAIYAAAITRVDRAVGDLVAHLKRTGQFENTLILFMSDNGGNAETGPDGIAKRPPLGAAQSDVFVGMNWAQMQNTPFRSFKHFTDEGGIATPLIAHWPAGIAPRLAGSLQRDPSHLIDIMPTVLEITGARYPKRMEGTAVLPFEGRSLAPAFAGRALARDKPLFWEHEGNRAVRMGRWKAVSTWREGWRLYDMAVDRTELVDLGKQHPERLADMTNRWDRWAARTFVDPWRGEKFRAWGGLEKPRRERGLSSAAD